MCQGKARGDDVKSSRTHYLDVCIVPGKVVAVHVFLSQRYKQAGRILERDDAHRTELLMHRTGTNSKRPQEAKGRKA